MVAVDERPVFETRLHPASLAGTGAFAAFVVGATALVVYRNPLSTTTILELWLAALVVVALSAAAPVARWRSSRFSVSPQRLTISSGGFRARQTEIALAHVAEITVTPGLLGGLLGYGTVRIVQTGEPPETFTRVAAPTALRDAVLRYARGPRRRTS
jgi:uncharacterized membrane protein YdbT with pleckstrin-like domain